MGRSASTPLSKKLLLPPHNHLASAQNGAFALRDVAHQLQRGAEALLHVLLHFFVGFPGDQHAPVALAQAQAGQVFFVHGDHPLAAALDKEHIGLDQPRLLAVVQAPRPRIEGADEFHRRVRFFRRDLRRARQVFHVALLQQRQVTVHNQRRHFHGAPPLLDLGFGLVAEAAMRVRRPSLSTGPPYKWPNSCCCAAI